MRKASLMLFAFVVTAMAAACTPSDPGIQFKNVPIDRDQISQGRVLYEQICAACHGIDGQGQFPDAPFEPDATGRLGAPPHNDMGHTWHHTDEMLMRYVRDGGFADLTNFYQMPSFSAVLTPDQIMQILGYIKTMWTPEQRINQYQLTQEEERMVAEAAQ